MANEVEKLLREVNQQLGRLVPLAEENKEELREIRDWKLQLEQREKIYDPAKVELRLRELEVEKRKRDSEKRLTAIRPPTPPPTQRDKPTGVRKRLSREVMVQVGALLVYGFLVWLVTHLTTIAKVAKIMEAGGGK